MSLNPHLLNASKPKYLSYLECSTSHFTIKYMGKCSPIMQQYIFGTFSLSIHGCST